MEKKGLTEIQLIAEQLKSRWGIEDENTKELSRKIGRFISQVNKSDAELSSIFFELIKNYNYYSRNTIENILKKIKNDIYKKYNLSYKDTIYSSIDTNAIKSSSNNLLEEYKTINDIPNGLSYNLKDLSIEECKGIINMVFIDDIIGSGNTIVKFFKQFLDKLKCIQNIYIFCIEITEEGLTCINDYCNSTGLTCIIDYTHLQKKAFEENHIFFSDSKKLEEILKNFELILWNNNSNYVLGYDNTQSLVSFFRNTPNNTISSFWFENENKKWKGLFPRKNIQPNFKIEQKKKMNYNLAKKGYKNNEK